MLRIPAPVVDDRTNQWKEAYDTAEKTVNISVYKFLCLVNEETLDMLTLSVRRQNPEIPVQIVAAAVLTAVNDLHEQYHNRV